MTICKAHRSQGTKDESRHADFQTQRDDGAVRRRQDQTRHGRRILQRGHAPGRRRSRSPGRRHRARDVRSGGAKRRRRRGRGRAGPRRARAHGGEPLPGAQKLHPVPRGPRPQARRPRAPVRAAARHRRAAGRAGRRAEGVRRRGIRARAPAPQVPVVREARRHRRPEAGHAHQGGRRTDHPGGAALGDHRRAPAHGAVRPRPRRAHDRPPYRDVHAEGGLPHRRGPLRRLHPAALHARRAERGRLLPRPRPQQPVHLCGSAAAARPLRHPHAPGRAARVAAGDVPRHRAAPRHGGGPGRAPGMGAPLLRHAVHAQGDYGHAHAVERAQAVSSAVVVLRRHGARQPGRHLPQHRQLREGEQVRRRHGPVLRQGARVGQRHPRVRRSGRRRHPLDPPGERHGRGRRPAGHAAGRRGGVPGRVASRPARIPRAAHEQRR